MVRSFFSIPASQSKGILHARRATTPVVHLLKMKRKAIGLKEVQFNTPTIINAFASRWFFWDGRATSLQSQVLQTIASRDEHAMDRGYIAQVILKKYKQEYEGIFGPISSAIATEKPRGIPIIQSPTLHSKVSRYSFLSLDGRLFFDWVVEVAKVRSEDPIGLLLSKMGPKTSETEITLHRNYYSWNDTLRREVDNIFLNFGASIAAFQSQIVANNAPFDRFIKAWTNHNKPQEAFNGEFGAVEFEGFQVFVGKGNCISCHHGPTLSDQEFHNIGLPQIDRHLTIGRAIGILKAQNYPFNCLQSGDDRDTCEELPYIDSNNLDLVGATKTPTLRNIAETAPYFHDGRAQTLENVILHYAQMPERVAIGHQEETLKNIALTKKERENLVQFLKSLTSKVQHP